ncbi:hypothetical protein IWX63_001190 [Arthrobacter sp. CAN_A2]|uniref:DUF6314 family protein n=1 Tax=Arthrobacter sp. CAN_A2 TaxID=2787718 RepID=UPI0018EFFC01
MQDAVQPPASRTVGPVPVPDPLTFLAGTWTTERTMLDRAGSATGTFTGTTTFTPDGGGLRWDEEGTACWSSYRGPAFRSYRVDVEDARVVVTFPDGRVLCRLDLGRGHARDEHPCSPDTYRVDFTVTRPGSIEYSWDVTGPAKDLLLTTTLTRRA